MTEFERVLLAVSTLWIQLNEDRDRYDDDGNEVNDEVHGAGADED
jgi:hypothetical protein